MNNDLISREALRKNMEFICMGIMAGTEPYNAPLTEIDNAPTVEYPFYAEAYQTGYEEAKGKIIHSIAKQYSDHNELVPIWLSIGDIKGGVKNDT